MSRSTKLAVARPRVPAAVALGAAAVALLFALTRPVAQPVEYHRFADTRALFDVPNFWNVVTNVPFFVVGFLGLAVLRDGVPRGGLPELRDAYDAFFGAALLIALGSALYHLAPGHATLLVDRLPMTVAFMAFVAIVIGEHVDARAGARALRPLVALGVGSVLYWYATELGGRGDLRPYLLVQFAPLAVVPVVLWRRPSRLTGVGYLWAALGAYALAKGLEAADAPVHALVGVGGHAFKHVIAACGMACVAQALRRRAPAP